MYLPTADLCIITFGHWFSVATMFAESPWNTPVVFKKIRLFLLRDTDYQPPPPKTMFFCSCTVWAFIRSTAGSRGILQTVENQHFLRGRVFSATTLVKNSASVQRLLAGIVGRCNVQQSHHTFYDMTFQACIKQAFFLSGFAFQLNHHWIQIRTFRNK